MRNRLALRGRLERDRSSPLEDALSRRAPVGKLDLMKNHVDTLCQENKVQVERLRPGANARAIRCFWLIQIPPVRGPVSYAVALHEIGHILGSRQSSKSTMTREKDAWRWARRNAVVEWTEAMARCERASVSWYKSRGFR
jgi:hypothetical protein